MALLDFLSENAKKLLKYNPLTSFATSAFEYGKDIAQDIIPDIKETFKGYGEAIERRAESFAPVWYGDYSPLHKGIRLGAETLNLASDLIGETFIGAGKLLLPEKTEQKISQGVEALMSDIAQTSLAQNLMRDWARLPEEGKQTFKTIGLALGAAIDWTPVGKAGTKLAKKLVKVNDESVVKDILKKEFDFKAPDIDLYARKIAKTSDKRVIKNLLDEAVNVENDFRQTATKIFNEFNAPEEDLAKLTKTLWQKDRNLLDELSLTKKALRDELKDVDDTILDSVIVKKAIENPTKLRNVDKIKVETRLLDDIVKAKTEGKSFEEWWGMQNKVYHGTNQKFDVFKMMDGQDRKGYTSKEGFWFTKSIDEAKQYAELSAKRNVPNKIEHDKKVEELLTKIELAERQRNYDLAEELTRKLEDLELNAINKSPEGQRVIEAKLFINNPKIVDGKRITDNQAEIIKQAKKDGHDAVIFKDITDSPFEPITTDQIVVFNSDKIKTKSQLQKLWQEADKIIKKQAEIKPAQVQAGQKTYLPATTGTNLPATPEEVSLFGKSFVATAPKEVATPVELAKKDLLLETKIPSVIRRHHGHIDRLKAKLQKLGLDEEEIGKLTLEDGTPLKDVVRVKRNKKGDLVAVITKKDLEDIKKSFIGKEQTKVVQATIARKIKSGSKELARMYTLPQVYYKVLGLFDKLYRPVRNAEDAAEIIKQDAWNTFKKYGVFKEGGIFTPDKIDISKKEAKKLFYYFASRQGKIAKDSNLYTTFAELSPKAQKVAKALDEVIAKYEPRFFEVARKNNKFPGKVPHGYAPLYRRLDLTEEPEAIGDMEFIFRNHPAFGSLKARKEKVPLSVYEHDYRKVISAYVNGLGNFIGLGDTVPEVKYLINSKEFEEIVGRNVKEYAQHWLRSVTTPPRYNAPAKLSRLGRKLTAYSVLGLNYSPVLKQALTLIPVMLVSHARPKLRSKFAKAFKINVKELPVITTRKGDIALADLQNGIGKALFGPLSSFDRKMAQMALNGLLDKKYKMYLKAYKKITPELRDRILKDARDELEMWFGGMTKSQLPEAFRTEVGKALNMFIYPVTSQLNGFLYHIFKEQGIKKAERLAEAVAAALAIAYAEKAISNLSFQWSDEKEMTKDILKSFIGNIPIISQIIYAFDTKQPLNLLSATNGISEVIKKASKYTDGQADELDILLALANAFGTPKSITNVVNGIRVVKEQGIRDKNGKLLVPVTEVDEAIRTLLKGKYGSLAAKDWARNLSLPKEQRRWFFPQVEFLQNGDWVRRMELLDQLKKEDLDFILKQFSNEQKKEFKKWYIAKKYPNLTRAEVGRIFYQNGLSKKPNITKAQYLSYLRRVKSLQEGRMLSRAEAFPEVYKNEAVELLVNKVMEKVKKGVITPAEAKQILLKISQ